MIYIPMLNNIAAAAHRMLYWHTPYRTGNLARNGIRGVQTFYYGNWGYNVGFKLFDGPGTEYGPLLNELPVIRYNVVAPWNGQRYQGSYVNRHYMWVDNFADAFAAELPLLAPVRRVA